MLETIQGIFRPAQKSGHTYHLYHVWLGRRTKDVIVVLVGKEYNYLATLPAWFVKKNAPKISFACDEKGRITIPDRYPQRLFDRKTDEEIAAFLEEVKKRKEPS